MNEGGGGGDRMDGGIGLGWKGWVRVVGGDGSGRKAMGGDGAGVGAREG